jgi:hypothetical protein
MRLAFLMPSNNDRQRIEAAQERIIDLRPDQIKHLEHLLRSWRIFGRWDGVDLTWRAIKRTLRDKP